MSMMMCAYAFVKRSMLYLYLRVYVHSQSQDAFFQCPRWSLQREYLNLPTISSASTADVASMQRNLCQLVSLEERRRRVPVSSVATSSAATSLMSSTTEDQGATTEAATSPSTTEDRVATSTATAATLATDTRAPSTTHDAQHLLQMQHFLGYIHRQRVDVNDDAVTDSSSPLPPLRNVVSGDRVVARMSLDLKNKTVHSRPPLHPPYASPTSL